MNYDTTEKNRKKQKKETSEEYNNTINLKRYTACGMCVC